MMISKTKLLSTTVIPFVAGAGVIVGTALVASAPSQATATRAAPAPLPAAKPRPAVRLVACNPCNPCAAKACNPCAAKNPCNPCNPCAAAKACNPCSPCAAKNPCNPCAAAACNPCNPCNPCGAGGGAVSAKCFVPRLVAAWKTSPCNPCSPCYAGKACNPCNPCAAKNPCNPCAAKNPCSPCNPCAAKNPCNPCAAANPCNPCGAGAAVEISSREAAAVYDCLRTEMTTAYEKAGISAVAGYTNWTNVAQAPYPSATHGSRYVNNYANSRGAFKYVKYEDVGTMPAGAALAKDSFVVNADGTVSVGPLFVMEKMGGGFNAESRDWRYSMILPTGAIFGVTGGKGSANVAFCIECHAAVADDQDSLFFLPEELRVGFD